MGGRARKGSSSLDILKGVLSMGEMKVPEFNGKYGEIFKLHKMLEEAGIQHEFYDETPDTSWVVPGLGFDYTKYHIFYPSWDEYRKGINLETYASSTGCSVIEGYGTYGDEQDLLEIMGLLTPEEEECGSVCGYLTAENVFERIKAAEERRKELFRHTAPVDTDYLVKEED
jgi:hypothetical protein